MDRPAALAASILVIDDNAENRALAEAALEDEGYRVVLAASGADGLRAFESAPADLVLLDVRMPQMDGFETCQRLRALPGGSETPVIFLTAARDVDSFDKALGAGADDFVTKPFRAPELVTRVETALKLRRLGAELREHYDLVRQQRDSLLRLQLQKERLMSFVVHDLKNPVNGIDLRAQLLLRDAELGAGARRHAREIREEVRSLLRLILNLLDISKSEEGRLAPQRERVELSPMVERLLEAHAPRALAAQVGLSSAVEADALSADPELLGRVLENLLDNAIRHAPEGSEVHLGAKPLGDFVELRVRDGGPGVAPEHRHRIFDAFLRLESGDGGKRTSRGLGLTFAKLAVEAHGGTISVEDGHPGAVFLVRLPRGD